MLASLLIVFREVLEAGLIVGIVLAATQGISGRGMWIAGGIGAGVLGAGLLASFAGAVSGALAGMGQEVLTASILIVAVLMLGWHNIWMASHGREMAHRMKAMGRSVAAGQTSLFAMAVVVGSAVLREGAEVVLFLYGIAASSREGPMPLLAGGLIGVALGGLVAWLIYRGLLALPVRQLFAVTSALICLLAAGMAGQAAATLAGAGLIPSLGDQLWDTSAVLSDASLLGRAMRALVGYSDRPMGVQVLAFVVVLAALAIASQLVQRGSQRAASRVVIPAPHA